MMKRFFISVISVALVSACGTANLSDKGETQDAAISDSYETHDASVDVAEQKFNAFLLDEYGEQGMSLTAAPTVVAEPPSVKPDDTAPEKDAEKKRVGARLGHMNAQRDERKEHERPGKRDHKERVKPAFVLALEASRHYAMALIGLDKSPFENFRAAIIAAMATAKTEAEFRTAVDAAKKVFESEKEAAFAKVEAARSAHKAELDALKVARKAVVAACVVPREKDVPILKLDAARPLDSAKTPPTPEEIAARKLAREAERKDEQLEHADRVAKANSTECLAATKSLTTMIVQ